MAISIVIVRQKPDIFLAVEFKLVATKIRSETR